MLVYWRQPEALPARVDLVPHKAEAEGRGTFMLTLTPGMDLQPITEGRDWVFVLDRSGSMEGKMATLGEGVGQALSKLRSEDRFRIVTFSNNSDELTSGFVAVTPEAVARWTEAVRNVRPNGGTNLYAGLDKGLKTLDADRTGAVVLVTDGEANVGVTETRRFLDLVKRQDTRLFTAIMGNSANTPLLEPLTRVSGGTAARVSNSDDVAGVLVAATGKVAYEALTDLSVSVEGEGGEGGTVRIADLEGDDLRSLYRGEQLVLTGHYWGEGPARVVLEGRIGGEPKRYETVVAMPATATRNPEIERLWAFQAIEKRMEDMALLGVDADAEAAVVDLSVENGLLTPLTAMIVVREERFEELGIARNNRDRLAIETEARDARAQAPVQTTRVDTSTPMFTTNRPSHSGGGSGNSGLIGLVFAFAAMVGGLVSRRARA